MQDNSSEDNQSSENAASNLDSIKETTIPPVTSKADEEEVKYKNERDKNAHDQQESLKKIFHSLASVILFVLGWSVITLLLVRLVILITPTDCHWLNTDQVDKIDQLFNYIIVGSVGSSVFDYFKKNIKPD